MQSQWLKLVDLFSVSHDSRIYNRDDRRSVFYAQSWVTVHFFMSKNMMKQVSTYVRSEPEDQHVAVPEAIRRSFGMEPEALGKGHPRVSSRRHHVLQGTHTGAQDHTVQFASID